ncbi:hypothetical protein HY491_03080 [Candidatus Woesearchaeota archaeon]|nr:hypothetical protein [Candidatus Woesearchaeota archaeon]
MARLTFIRHAPNRKKRLGRYWRRPKGGDSKLRLRVRGHGLSVSIGYRRKGSERGMLRNGLRERRIETMRDVNLLNIKTEAAVLSSTLGLKQKAELAKALAAKGAVIMNMKDPKGFLARMEQQIAARKHERESEKKGKESLKEAEKAEARKSAVSEKKEQLSEDELAKKVEEEEKIRKKEYEKVLTKRT